MIFDKLLLSHSIIATAINIILLLYIRNLWKRLGSQTLKKPSRSENV